jgi:hypothetical protein
MTMWQRLKYAWIATVTVVGVIVVADIAVSAFVSGVFWGNMIFSPLLVLPIFAISWVAAPKLRQWFPESR